jgi:hypothetical protein
MRPFLGPLDPAAFSYAWTHPDPRMDALQREVAEIAAADARSRAPAPGTLARIRAAAERVAGPRATRPASIVVPPRPIAPRLTEPWFC